jgi:hypothetical protein
MTPLAELMSRHSPRLIALSAIVVSFGLARLPHLSETDRTRLANRFSFTSEPLAECDPPTPARGVRAVPPSLQRISAWISSVGAAVALHDLDGDGLPNDVVLVDPRTDRVSVAPVPGSPARYRPFVLAPDPLPYEPATMAPMGSLAGDFNEDGLRDVMVYYWGRTPILFLRKPGDAGQLSSGGRAFVPSEVEPLRGRWFTNAATTADLDGDGHLDLIIGNYFPDDCRVLDTEAVGQSPMQHSMSRAFNGGRKRILLWDRREGGTPPRVRYREAKGILDEEVACGWTLAIGAADLDGDLLPELYFANDFGPDRLLHNRSTPGSPRFALLGGQKTLCTPNSKVLGRDSFKGMGVDFGDLNGDGILDFFVSNIAAEYMLEESHFVFVSTGQLDQMEKGIAPYVDRSEPLGLSRSGWGWDTKLGDFDNDGRLEALQAMGFARGTINRWPELQELAMGNDEFLSDPANWPRFQPGDDLSGHQNNVFSVQDENGRFWNIGDLLGLVEPGVSRGIALADVDGDGRLDFAVANQWAPSTFHRNTARSAGAFLGLHLLLPLPGEEPSPTRVWSGHPGEAVRGRPAVGAAAMVILPDQRRLVGQVDGGNGHSGKRSPDLHFGLGTLSPGVLVNVLLSWRDPTGRVQRQGMDLTAGWHTVLLGSLPTAD